MAGLGPLPMPLCVSVDCVVAFLQFGATAALGFFSFIHHVFIEHPHVLDSVLGAEEAMNRQMVLPCEV